MKFDVWFEWVLLAWNKKYICTKEQRPVALFEAVVTHGIHQHHVAKGVLLSHLWVTVGVLLGVHGIPSLGVKVSGPTLLCAHVFSCDE